jgi:hypothetical protein
MEQTAQIPELWYENEQGKRWIPDERHFRELSDPPDGYVYQRTQFACSVTDDIIRIGVGKVASGTTTYSPDLALAMARPSLGNLLRALLRGYPPWREIGLRQAILRAISCERCMNALAHRHGCSWGYRKGSPKYIRAGTSCELCRTEGELDPC